MADEIEIPGRLLDDKSRLVDTIKRRISEELNIPYDKFPGSQPVSFTKRHIEEVTYHEYMVVEKTDGLRCLMYISNKSSLPEKQRIFFITRKYEIYEIEGITFDFTPRDHHQPPKENDGSSNGNQAHNYEKYDSNSASASDNDEKELEISGDFLYDTELVKVKDSSNLKLLIFDILIFDGQECISEPYSRRVTKYRYLEDAYRRVKKNFSNETYTNLFKLNFKIPLGFYDIGKIFQFSKHQAAYETDGVIITKASSQYRPGTDENVLKWKPPHLNSIDFLLRLCFNHAVIEDGDKPLKEYTDYDSLPYFSLWVWMGRQKNEYLGELHVNETQWQWFKSLNEPLDNRVVECVLDDYKRWTFLRFRDDKENANHVNTYEKVKDSILDAITADELSAHAIKRKQILMEHRSGEHMVKRHRRE